VALPKLVALSNVELIEWESKRTLLVPLNVSQRICTRARSVIEGVLSSPASQS